MDNPRSEPRIRVAAFIHGMEGVLMVRHVKNQSTYWLLPGGGVEWGETLGEALRREVIEETGYEVETGDILFVNDTIAPNGSRHVVNICLEAHITGGVPRLGEDDVLAESRFITPGELDRITMRPDLRAHLARRLAGKPLEQVYLGGIWR